MQVFSIRQVPCGMGRTGLAGGGAVGSLEAALGHVASGWPVLPLCWPSAGGACACGGDHGRRAAGKAPLPGLGRGWPGLRADAQGVRSWWARWPEANVGILLGPAGLLVLDLDGAAAAAEAERWGCPPTRIVRRGPERLHLYYRRPAEAPEARRIGHGSSGAIDVLASGYVVAPPSRHASGDRYRVSRDVPPAEAPAWAVAALRGAGAGPAAAVRPDPDRPGALALARALLAGTRLGPVLEQGPGGAPGRYRSRSEAVAALEAALLGRGLREAEVAGALLALPWVAAMRPDAPRWLSRDVARLSARRRPAPDPALAPGARALLASAGRGRRAAGALAAARAAWPPEAVAAALRAGGMAGDDAGRLSRWAARKAGGGGGAG